MPEYKPNEIKFDAPTKGTIIPKDKIVFDEPAVTQQVPPGMVAGPGAVPVQPQLITPNMTRQEMRGATPTDATSDTLAQFVTGPSPDFTNVPGFGGPRSVMIPENEYQKIAKERGEYLPPEIKGVLEENKNLNFVQRMVNPDKFPAIKNADGSVSTHKMSSGEISGKNIVYPTIIQEGDQLKQLPEKEAIEHAIKTKEYIAFPDKKSAEDFAEGAWKKQPGIDVHPGWSKPLEMLGSQIWGGTKEGAKGLVELSDLLSGGGAKDYPLKSLHEKVQKMLEVSPEQVGTDLASEIVRGLASAPAGILEFGGALTVGGMPGVALLGAAKTPGGITEKLGGAAGNVLLAGALGATGGMAPAARTATMGAIGGAQAAAAGGGAQQITASGVVMAALGLTAGGRKLKEAIETDVKPPEMSKTEWAETKESWDAFARTEYGRSREMQLAQVRAEYPGITDDKANFILEERGYGPAKSAVEVPVPAVTTSGDLAQTLEVEKPPIPAPTPPEIVQPAAAGEVVPMTFEEFSKSKGVSSTPPDFPESHRAPGGVSKTSARAMADRIVKANAEWQARRDEVRAEYDGLLAKGELRIPTRTESLTETAKLDTEAGEAARRLLAKSGKAPEVQDTVEAKAKEPWEMTRNEYLEANSTEGINNRQYFEHGQAVEQASASGKHVPPEVLADYPALAAKYAKVTTTEEAPTEAEPAKTSSRVYQDEAGWWRVEGSEASVGSQAEAQKIADRLDKMQASGDKIKAEEPSPLPATAETELDKKTLLGGGPDTRGRLFAPTDISKEINPLKKAEMILVNYHGQRAADWERANAAIDRVSRDSGFHYLSPDAFIDMLKGEVSAYQRGEAVSPELKKFIDVYNELRAPLEVAILKIKPDWQMRENYFRKMFIPRGKAWKEWAVRNKSSLEGSKGFLKESKYLSWEEGTAAGLRPRYNKLSEIVKADLAQKRQFVEGHQAFEELRREGIAEFLPLGNRLPDGKGYLEDRRFKVKQYVDRPGGTMVPGEADEQSLPLGGGPERRGYEEVPPVKGLMDRGNYIADKPIADLINQQFEPGITNKYIKAAIQATNIGRQIKVAISPFHFWNTDNNVRGLLTEIMKIAEGGVSSIPQSGKMLLPAVNTEQIRRMGRRLQEDFLEPGKHGPEADEAVLNLIEGGQRFNVDRRGIVRNLFKDTDQFGNIFKDAFYDAWHEIKKPGLLAKASLVPKALKNVLDASSAWIMKYTVPQVKVGIHQIITQPELAALNEKYGVADRKASDPSMQKTYETERMAINQGASKIIDDIFGQMVKDNIMIRPVFKDLASAAIQFPTWTIGTARGGYSAGKGTYKVLADQPINLHEKHALRWASGLLLNTLIYGAIVHRFFTGDWPDNFKDASMPIIDPKTGDRLMMGGYMRTYMAWNPISAEGINLERPARAAVALKNQAIGIVWDTIWNKDWSNARIWTPHSPSAQIGKEYATHLAREVQPIITSQMELTQNPMQKLAPLVGWQRPAKYLSNTKLEQAIVDVGHGGATKSRKEGDYLKLEHSLLETLKQQGGKAFVDSLKEAESNKLITPGKMERIIKKAIDLKSGKTPLMVSFIGLPIEEAIRVFPLGTDQEKKQLAIPLFNKLASVQEKDPKRLEPLRDDIKLIFSEIKKTNKTQGNPWNLRNMTRQLQERGIQ